MPVVRIAPDGRILIPEDVLSGLGVRPGDEVMIEMRGGNAILVPSRSVGTPGTGVELRTAMNRKNLETPISCIKGVGPKTAEFLAKKGIRTVEDALYLLPNRYEDRRKLLRIAELRSGHVEVFFAEVRSATTVASKGGRSFFEVVAADETGTIILKWFNFNQRIMKGMWQPGKKGVFTGEVVAYGSKREIRHPEVEWLKSGIEVEEFLTDDPLNFGRIVPVYPLTEGLQQKLLRKILKNVVDGYSSYVETIIPANIRSRHSLDPVACALREVHFPGEGSNLEHCNGRVTRAHRSLVFDEFFFIQLGLALKKHHAFLEAGIPFQVTHKYTRPLLKLLPFNLTVAQKRVLTEIKEDMARPHPMHRLVQGDVGSGKTVVALMSALLAVENGCQVAIMTPTEILAEQHYLNIHCSCGQLGISVRLLTARIKGKSRTALLDEIASGQVQIVIGTHAVIQEKVAFSRLGLGIIDEQHRFGVLQRSTLKKMGLNPHILVMTATPIPRTLAMTVFGDLSLSVIDEIPPGRSPVVTRVCLETQRLQVYGHIREEVKGGRQAYIVYPLVEESDASELKAARQMAEHLATCIFPELRVGLLHGRLEPGEKETVMRSFKAGETDILVATTVIEVGVDVPNATVMMVEHAERFGLSQLHQLRGRVGRGSAPSRCILMAGGSLSAEAEQRLSVMEETTDGFRIAEADLELRGPGDFLGTRQAGFPDFRVASIIRDGRILEEARREAFTLVEQDPRLEIGENLRLREEVMHRWGGRLELAGIA
jgi:ATP-dependent DNA helicase RecG